MTHESKSEGGKVAKKKKVKTARLSPNGKLIPTEGLMYFSFGFDGKKHVKAHQLNEFEISYLKEMLTEHGEQTAKSAISKAAIQNSAILCENVLATAFLEFIKKHHTVAAEKSEALPIPEDNNADR